MKALKRKDMNYPALLKEVKDRIRRAQIRASLAANAELLAMYWDIGRVIDERQMTEGWGAAIVPRLAKDICNDLPEIKGFSEQTLNVCWLFIVNTGG